MKPRESKKITTVSFFTIFALCFIIVTIRWINIFNENVFVISNEINSHITNLNISLMLCTLIGYLLLCYKKKYIHTIIIGILIICVNLIFETLLTFINTTDFIDAIYGIIGVVISLVYLYFIDKKGFND